MRFRTQWSYYIFLKNEISIETVEYYVKSLGEPKLLDLIVQLPSRDVNMDYVMEVYVECESIGDEMIILVLIPFSCGC